MRTYFGERKYDVAKAQTKRNVARNAGIGCIVGTAICIVITIVYTVIAGFKLAADNWVDAPGGRDAFILWGSFGIFIWAVIGGVLGGILGLLSSFLIRKRH